MKTAPPGAYREDAAVGTVPVTSVTVAAARADANLENMLLSQKATTPKPSQRSTERPLSDNVDFSDKVPVL